MQDGTVIVKKDAMFKHIRQNKGNIRSNRKDRKHYRKNLEKLRNGYK